MQVSGIARQRRILIGAALAATAALLVGFHSVTAYLSAVTLSATAERTPPAAAGMPPPASDQARPAAPSEAAVAPPRALELPNPTGIAAAAKAKAQAEMDELEQAPPEAPSANSPRRYRAPKTDLHRVY